MADDESAEIDERFAPGYEFRCPACDEAIDVNAPMREALLDHGCPMCGAVPEPVHFERE